MRLFISCAMLLITVGCQSQATLVQSDKLRVREPLPLETVRDDFAAAQTIDSELQLGFFHAAWVDDYSANGVIDARSAELLGALRDEVAQSSWGQPGRRAFREGRWLVVFQNEDVIQQIRPWLTEYANRQLASSTMIMAEMKVFGAEGEDLISRQTPGKRVAMSDEAVAELLEQENVTILSAPKLSVHSGQRGSIQVINQQAYVSGYDVFYLDGEGIAEPRIDVLQSGLVIELQPRVEEDGTISTQLDATVSELLEMKSEEQRLVGDTTVTREIPIMRTNEIATTLRAASGAWTLIGPLGNGPEYVLIRLRTVEPKKLSR